MEVTNCDFKLKRPLMKNLIPSELIENRIFVIRGVKVMLDRDLAKLYRVEVKVLNQAVQRNLDRFPKDFMFKITRDEASNLKSQIVTSSLTHGGRRKPISVFTEQGVAMLSSVLKSKQAIAINIQIMRTFVAIRNMALDNSDIHRKIEFLEKNCDDQFKIVFDALRKILSEKETDKIELQEEKPEIGFKAKRG